MVFLHGFAYFVLQVLRVCISNYFLCMKLHRESDLTFDLYIVLNKTRFFLNFALIKIGFTYCCVYIPKHVLFRNGENKQRAG